MDTIHVCNNVTWIRYCRYVLPIVYQYSISLTWTLKFSPLQTMCTVIIYIYICLLLISMLSNRKETSCLPLLNAGFEPKVSDTYSPAYVRTYVRTHTNIYIYTCLCVHVYIYILLYWVHTCDGNYQKAIWFKHWWTICWTGVVLDLF